MITNSFITKVKIVDNYKELYIRREVLGGMIMWWDKIASHKLGHDLEISTDQDYDKVFVNGQEFIKSLKPKTD